MTYIRLQRVTKQFNLTIAIAVALHEVPADYFYGLDLRSSQPRSCISDSTSHWRKVSLSIQLKLLNPTIPKLFAKISTQPNPTMHPWMDPTHLHLWSITTKPVAHLGIGVS